jgi:hypothetical protein
LLLFRLEPAMAKTEAVLARCAAPSPCRRRTKVAGLQLQGLVSSPCAAPRPPRRLTHERPLSNAEHEQADQARPHRQQPRLISRYAATHEADYAAGDGSDDPDGVIGVTFLRLAGARLAADFLAAPFLPADFFAAVLLAELFFAEAFFTAPLRVAFLATTLRADFFAGFLAADFFAVFLAAAFGMYRSLSIICSQRKFRAMQMRERRYIRFDFAQALHTRATRAERGDYRIIARTRACGLSSTRVFACGLGLRRSKARAAMRSIRQAANASAHDPRFAHIFRASSRIERLRANAIARAR